MAALAWSEEITVDAISKWLERPAEDLAKVTSIDFPGRLIDDKVVAIVGTVALRLVHLRTINLSRNQIGDEGATSLARCLELLPGSELDCLDMSGNCFAAKGAEELARMFFAAPVRGGPAGLSGMPPAVEDGSPGRVASHPSRPPRERVFDLSTNGLQDAGAQAVARHLCGQRGVCLRLRAVQCGVRGLSAILSFPECLAELDVSENPIGLVGITALFRDLAKAEVWHTVRLAQLQLPKGTSVAGLVTPIQGCLGQNRSLRRVDVSGNRLGDAGSAAIAKALLDQQHLALEGLHMSGTGSGQHTAEAFRGVLLSCTGGRELQELHLDDNALDDSAVGALSEGISHNTTLAVLRLARNRIGSAGARALADALAGQIERYRDTPSLQPGPGRPGCLVELDLSDNPVSEDGIEALAKAAMVSANESSAVAFRIPWGLEVLRLDGVVLGERGEAHLGAAMAARAAMADSALSGLAENAALPTLLRGRQARMPRGFDVVGVNLQNEWAARLADTAHARMSEIWPCVGGEAEAQPSTAIATSQASLDQASPVIGNPQDDYFGSAPEAALDDYFGLATAAVSQLESPGSAGLATADPGVPVALPVDGQAPSGGAPAAASVPALVHAVGLSPCSVAAGPAGLGGPPCGAATGPAEPSSQIADLVLADAPGLSREASSSAAGTKGKGKGDGKGKPAPPPKAAAAAVVDGQKDGPSPELGKGKGKGKGPPPAKQTSAAAKGTEKGKAPPGSKAGAQAKSADASRMASAVQMPFGRRIHFVSTNYDDPHEESIFGQLGEGEEVPVEFDPQLLEAMLGQQMKLPSRRASMGVRPAGIAILDGSRAQNIAIVLNKMPMTSEAMCEKLLAMEFEGSNVTLDTIELLLDVLPNTQEAEKLVKHVKNVHELRDVEQKVMPFVTLPQCAVRLRVMHLASSHEEFYKQLMQRCATVISASKEVRDSAPLRAVMRVVLRVGNFINHGAKDMTEGHTFKAFAVESLSTLTSFKTGTISTMHFLCLTLRLSTPSFYSMLQTSLANVKAAAREQTCMLKSSVENFCKDAELAERVGPMRLAQDDASKARMDQLVSELHSEVGRIKEQFREAVEAGISAQQYFSHSNSTAVSNTFPPCEQFFGHLISFLNAFECTWQEVERNPSVYKQFAPQVVDTLPKPRRRGTLMFESRSAEAASAGAATPVLMAGTTSEDSAKKIVGKLATRRPKAPMAKPKLPTTESAASTTAPSTPRSLVVGTAGWGADVKDIVDSIFDAPDRDEDRESVASGSVASKSGARSAADAPPSRATLAASAACAAADGMRSYGSGVFSDLDVDDLMDSIFTLCNSPDRAARTASTDKVADA